MEVITKHPELAVFLTLGLGYLLGNFKIGNFKLGGVTGVLLVGILVGQTGVEVDEDLLTVFFLLFIFAIGYGVGPQFFAGLKKGGLKQGLFSLIVCTVSLLTAYLAAKLLGFDSGTGAGLLSGGNTSSAILGVASDTIKNLPNDEATKKQLLTNIPVAYAVTYIFGTAGVSWFLGSIGPKLLGNNVKEQCKALESEMGGEDEENANMRNAYDRATFRAFQLSAGFFDKPVTVQQLEDYLKTKGSPVFVQRIRKKEQLMDAEPDTVLENGDLAVISGQRTFMLGIEDYLGVEVADAELLSFPVETRIIRFNNKQFQHKKIKDLLHQHFSHGISIRNIKRSSVEMPISPMFELQRGDSLELVGVKEDLDKAERYLGFAEKGGYVTDIVFVAFGILVGCLIGLITYRLNNIPISLSTSGGTLLAGLLCGWLRSRYPVIGNIPLPSQLVLKSLGLNIFIAGVGINHSLGFIDGLKQLGFSLFFAGVIVSILPMVVGLLLGRYVFKFHPAITLGACAGAHTETAALGAIQEAIESKTPALGYTVTYAVANIVLATYGVIIVMMLS